MVCHTIERAISKLAWPMKISRDIGNRLVAANHQTTRSIWKFLMNKSYSSINRRQHLDESKMGLKKFYSRIHVIRYQRKKMVWLVWVNETQRAIMKKWFFFLALKFCRGFFSSLFTHCRYKSISKSQMGKSKLCKPDLTGFVGDQKIY